jgi:hypothetical protein
MLERVAEAGRFLLYGAALVVGIGAVSHALGWLLVRRGTVSFVWAAWNVLGALLLAAGVAVIGYGWLGVGLHTGWGSTVAGVGLLLASAGIWMLVPI